MNHVNLLYMRDLFTKKEVEFDLELRYSASFHMPDDRDLVQIN